MLKLINIFLYSTNQWVRISVYWGNDEEIKGSKAVGGTAPFY